MMHRSPFFNQFGFTLVELISTMVILSVVSTVVVKKFDLLNVNAESRVLFDGVKELNARETLIWIDFKLSPGGWTDDSIVYPKIETSLGDEYAWSSGPTSSGGRLEFGSQAIVLTRKASTYTSPGSWQ